MRKLFLLMLLLCIIMPASAELINVSEGKPATASSEYNADATANKTTDGITQAAWPIFHSANGDFDPWLMVDLEQVELVKEVTIWNRADCCQVRMQDIQVEVLDENENIVFISELINPGNILDGPESATISFENTIPGRFVRIRRIPYDTGGHDGFILSINELQVFADGEVPSIASAPSPYNGEVNVPLEVTLSWNASLLADPNTGSYLNPDVIKHALYLSSGSPDDPNLVLVEEIAAGDTRIGYGPVTIDRDGVYYWRVDEIIPDSNGMDAAITGAVWQFDALTSKTIIDPATPVEQIIDQGADAVFNVSATNPFTGTSENLDYAWFKVDSEGDIPVGENSDTLTITAPTAADEGDYYCIVSVAGNPESATQSGTANLTIKRLLLHWPFEGNADEVVSGRNGESVGDPDFTIPGIIGDYAVDLDTDDAIHIPGAYVDLDSYCISVWVSHRGLPNDFQSVIHSDGWSNVDGAGSLHFHLRSDKSFSWGINGAGGDGRTAANTIPDADTWYHLVLSYRFGDARAFVNGVLVAQATAVTPNRSRVLPATIGAWLNGGSNSRFLNGKVDDLRVYNYPLSDEDIAVLNFEATGVPVCVYPPEFDLNGDCLVTLEDFAVMAAGWAECNRVPLSACD